MAVSTMSESVVDIAHIWRNWRGLASDEAAQAGV
jgi:hypothetical protein